MRFVVLSPVWCVLAFLSQGGTLRAQDTVRVRADGEPIWGRNVRLIQELIIGQLDGAPEYAFGEIHAGTLSPDGSFFIFDANDRQLRHYDRNGRFLRAIGKRGGGPGEYQYVAGMDVTRDGLLVIKDPENSRVTYFDRDGRVRKEFPVLRFGFYGTNFVIDTAGLVYMITSTRPGREEGPGAARQYLRLSSDGLLRDSIPLPFPGSVPRAFWLSTSDGMRWNFTPQDLHGFYFPGGYLAAKSHEYRVIIVKPGGPVMVIERDHEPLTIAGEERADWEKWVEYFRTRPGGAGRTYDLPRTKPAIRELRSDWEGRIWVDVFVPAEKRSEPPRPAGDVRPVLTWKERTTYDVFSPAGAYLGRIRLPAQTVMLAVRGDRLLARTKGQEGEDRVAVYRLATSGSR